MKNLPLYDVRIRIILSAIFILFSIYYQSYLLLIPAALLQYTASKGYCFIYKILGINHEILRHNEIVALLPNYNPSPVLIFNDQGQQIFRNNPAKQILGDIENLNKLCAKTEESIRESIGREASHTVVYSHLDHSYLITLVGVKKENLLMAYCQDITDVIKADQEIIQTQKEIVYTMGEIGETRSKETGYHVKRVAEYSALLAKKIGLCEEECELIKMASPMHDIGKIGIPDNILNKPGALDKEEWAIMQTHADLGYQLLKHSDRPILKASAIIAKEHHEKYDGSGYPLGLKGEEIHIYARITAIADVFDALGSERVYKKAWKLEEILSLFRKESGKQFEPRLTQIFFENLDDFLYIRDRYKE